VEVTLTESGTLTVAPRRKPPDVPSGTSTPSGASERAVRDGRGVGRERPRRRSVEALRKEAQQRLAQARRAGRNKRGGKTALSSKGKPRTFIKRSGSDGVSATLVVHWWPNQIIGTEACATAGSVGGAVRHRTARGA
jgi:hypothetical protein